jgi:hypothetical protein
MSMPSPKPSKAKQKTKAASPLARPGSKLAKVVELVSRPQGATIDELTSATGWKKHSVRGAIAGAIKKKLRQRVELIAKDDRRAYSIAKPAATRSAK